MNLNSILQPPPKRHKVKFKTALKMKITTFLLFAIVMQVSAVGTAQKVSLKFKNDNISSVFKEIEKQTNYSFVYGSEQLENTSKVNVSIRNEELVDALNVVFKDQPLTYTIFGNHIVLKEKKAAPVDNSTTVAPVQNTIRGKVVNEKGEPLPGVNIFLKGAKVAAQTDMDGKYVINAPANGILQFSFLGFKSEIVSVNGKSEINITLKQEASELNTVTINTGVTVRKKENMTGAISVYSGTELRQISTQNAVQALKTIDPSFILVDNNIAGSNPNILPNIEVRGTTSLNLNQVNAIFGQAPNQPLFILDGFPTSLQQVVDLDINRIASITLLKDAASTALYGSRSANGVVVIETIKPTAGKLRLSFTNNTAFELADLSVYNLMNAEQKLEFERLSGAYKSGINPIPQYEYDVVYNDRLAAVRRGVNTYWLNEPIQMGVSSRNGLTLGGGSEEFRYNIAVDYKTLSGTMKGSERNTWGYSTNLTYRKDKINISDNIYINGGNNQESPYGSFATYAQTSPYYPKYNAEGIPTPYLNGTYSPPARTIVNNPTNPLYNAYLPSFNNGNNFNFTNNLGVNYDFTTHIRANANISVSRNNTYSTVFISPLNTGYNNTIDSEKGSYSRNESLNKTWNANFGATYSNIFNNTHSVSYTVRASANESAQSSFGTILRGFPAGVPANPFFAFGYQANSKPSTYTGLNRGVDFTHQLNYVYDKRFLLDLTQTISGSTKFGLNDKYTPYWGAGLGWNLHNEFKMNENIVNNLKIRGSIGHTGNQNLSNTAAYDVYTYTANTNNFGAGLGLSQFANPDLQPQSTRDISLGLDLAMYRNRLTATLGAYEHKTTPQIINVDLAASTGVNSYPLNVGYVISRGLELKMNYNIIYNLKQNIVWGLGLTASSVENELGGFGNSLASVNAAALNSSSMARYYDGYSSNDLWAVRSLGIDPATGNEIFLKKDGQSTFIFDKKDEVKVGNSREIATGVISNNVTYKNFSFGLNMRYSFGADRLNEALYSKVENITSNALFLNQDARAFTDRWTTPGQIAQFKAISITNSTPISSRFVQKENYLSGESLRFGYKVTDKNWLNKAGLSQLGFNAYANEFFRISTLKAERGTAYPFSRIYSLSINVSF